MKKITKILRFFSLIFFLFLAVFICFAFNQMLDQKIEEQHKQTIEALEDF